MTVYILDTNVISDLASPVPNNTVTTHFASHERDAMFLCEAVDYEVIRGYLRKNATTQLRIYEQKFKPRCRWATNTEEDWRRAAQLWADAKNKGYQFSDVDLLIAAVAIRLGGIVVSSDNDFDRLPVTRENWRNP